MVLFTIFFLTWLWAKDLTEKVPSVESNGSLSAKHVLTSKVTGKILKKKPTFKIHWFKLVLDNLEAFNLLQLLK